MNQCVLAAEHMGLRPSSQKRRSSDDLSGYAKRVAYSPGRFEPAAAFAVAPSSVSSHKPILPRPSNDAQAQLHPHPRPQPPVQVSTPGPKKRGRPPRSDRALSRPMLPQIAPRPAEQSSDPTVSQSAYPPLPPLSKSTNAVAPGPRYSTSPGPSERKKTRKGRQQRADTAEPSSRPAHHMEADISQASTPRVLPEGGSRPGRVPNPIPIEPSLRSGAPACDLSHGMSPSFSHLLDRGSQIAPGNSSRSEAQAPLASSA